ncbi:hypothetical protein MMC19_005937 [Ptychographa xylographoides]|nr:hypothetical protein [Ptychographa xylographoides]
MLGREGWRGDGELGLRLDRVEADVETEVEAEERQATHVAEAKEKTASPLEVLGHERADVVTEDDDLLELEETDIIRESVIKGGKSFVVILAEQLPELWV